MNDNRSFLITLLLTVGSGAVIGLFAFGLTGRTAQPAPAPVASQAAAPPAPSPSTSGAEPVPPVQYDNADSASSPVTPPEPSAEPERQRKVLM